jgi:transposase
LPKTKEKREALALEVGKDGFVLLDALASTNTPTKAHEVQMVSTLREVWRIHYERVGDGVRWREVVELPPVGDRIQSPYDPEMHFSMKRKLEWSGYKVHVTETCDEQEAHLITHVQTCPAMEMDMTSTAEIHEKLSKKQLLPSEHFVDSAYVNAELLVQSKTQYGISLEGPVRGMAPHNTPGYELSDFKINWEEKHVICPQGKESTTWRERTAEGSSPKINARFSRTDCGACLVRSLCTSSKESRRSVHFHVQEEYEALNAARVRMNDIAWKEKYQVRAGVEGTLSQGVRISSLRRSRYVGLSRTALQEVCVGAGLNVLRAVNWLNEVPLAKTRVSKFMALALSA